MRGMGISRQLLLLLAVFGAVTVGTAGGLVWLLESSARSAERQLRAARKLNENGVELAGGMARMQGVVQKMLREKDPDALEKLIEQCESLAEQARAAIERDGAEALRGPFEALSAANRQVLEPVLRGEYALAQEAFIEVSSPAFDGLLEAQERWQREAGAGLAGESARTAARAGQIRTAICVLAGLVALAGLVFGALLRRTVVSELRSISGRLAELSLSLSKGAGEIDSASQAVAQGATEQAASIEEVSASVHEISASMKEAAETAERTRVLSASTREAADKGSGEMEALDGAMQEINQSSAEIARIIRTIDEIAFQTNILALNAAVEAARAGEAGMGFAVVADEVRNLAQRAAEAARETSGMIEGASGRSGRGLKLSAEVKALLAGIAAHAREMNSLVGEMASTGRDHSGRVESINTAMIQMERVTQNSAAQSEETASAAASLSSQSNELRRCVTALTSLVEGN